MRKRVICPLAWMAFLLAGASPLPAQDDPDLWSLERCIRYAQENNIDLKQKEQEKRERDFAAQEMARIRGVSATPAAHFTPKNRPAAVSFGGRKSTAPRQDKIDTTSGRKSATPVRPISYRKTPDGPNPMRMWREK